MAKAPKKVKALKGSFLVGNDWEQFVEHLNELYVEVVLDDTASDLVLNECWLIRKW